MALLLFFWPATQVLLLALLISFAYPYKEWALENGKIRAGFLSPLT
jgi:hypothetical protein